MITLQRIWPWFFSLSMVLAGCDEPTGKPSDGENQTIPLPDAVHVVKVDGQDCACGIGSTVFLTVTFSDAIKISGSPSLLLNLARKDSSVPVSARFEADISSSKRAVFSYVVAEGDHLLSGHVLDIAQTSALQLNGAKITDVSNNSVDLTLPAPGSANSLGQTSAIAVDGARPTVVGVALQSGKASTYTVSGSVVFIDVLFSEIVYVDGALVLALSNGRSALYRSGSGSDTLTFAYTVTRLDSAHPLTFDSSVPANALLSGGSVSDEFFNDGVLDINTQKINLAFSNIVIETQAPVVSRIDVSSATNCIACGIGSSFIVDVSFSKPVTLSRAATMELLLNSGATISLYIGSAVTGSIFRFGYEVEEGDSSGLAALRVEDFRIIDGTLVDALTPSLAAFIGEDFYTVVYAQPSAPIIDGVRPTVQSLRTANAKFGLNQAVPVTLNFSESVVLTDGGNDPTLSFSTPPGGVATCSSLTGSQLNCLYTVRNTDSAPQLQFTSGSFALNDAVIVDAAGNTAASSLANARNDMLAAIEGRALSVTSVTTSKATGTYGTLEPTIPVTVNFNRAARPTAAGTLTLTAGTGSRSLTIASSATSNSAIQLAYAVQATDAVATLSPRTLAGTFVDDFGNTLAVPVNGLSFSGSPVIALDGIKPTITNISVTQAAGSYKVGDTLHINVTFSEAVKSHGGNVLLTLSVGSPNRVLSTTALTKTATLSFSYVVAAGESVTNLKVLSVGLAAGAGLGDVDAAGTRFLNNADLALGGKNIPNGYSVDTTAPEAISGLSAYAIAGDLHNGTSVLNWTRSASPDAAGYLVWRSTSAITAPMPITPLPANTVELTVSGGATSSMSDAGLDGHTEYFYKIWAFDGARNYSSGSAVVSVKTRSWSYNGYLKGIQSGASDQLGGGLASSFDDNSNGKAVDIASWTLNGSTWLYGVAGASLSEQNINVVENGDDAQNNSDGSMSNNGAVYVFKREPSGTAWTQDAVLHPHCFVGGNSDARFGFSVSANSQKIAVGQPFDDTAKSGIVNQSQGIQPDCRVYNNNNNSGNNSNGGAYIFSQAANGDWLETAYIKSAAFNYSGAYFGWSIALSGSNLVVGAPGANNNDAGGALIYSFSNNAWGGERSLTRSFGQSYDHFGWAADIENRTVVVGAPQESHNCPSGRNECNTTGLSYSGAVYVYDIGSSSPQYYLKASNKAAYSKFGFSVAISGDTIVVGAPYEDSDTSTIYLGSDYGGNSFASDSGAAYVFTRSGDVWTQVAALKAPHRGDKAGQEHFGWSVDVAGDTIVVGAKDEDNNVGTITNAPVMQTTGSGDGNSGAAYLYRRIGTSWVWDAYLKAAAFGGVNEDAVNFGAAVAVDSQSEAVIVSAPLDGYSDANKRRFFTAGTTTATITPGNTSLGSSGAVYVFAP